MVFHQKGGSLSIRPRNDSVMEKPESMSKYEDEPVGCVYIDVIIDCINCALSESVLNTIWFDYI